MEVMDSPQPVEETSSEMHCVAMQTIHEVFLSSNDDMISYLAVCSSISMMFVSRLTTLISLAGTSVSLRMPRISVACQNWKIKVIHEIASHPQAITFLVGHGAKDCVCSVVYVSPKFCERNHAWDRLCDMRANISSPWFLIGDLNEIAVTSEYHCPLLVGCNCALKERHDRLFRFEAVWATHRDFECIVRTT
ncbi:hypothetical protein VNO78_22391 [Psophocarpus tetragonolobus]|uniref:Uncharacterized protein n=1 Tax=Psophocarpus tetragonolobus TaxID=3891 RepID=A0AAN9SDD2_PSOTE